MKKRITVCLLSAFLTFSAFQNILCTATEFYLLNQNEKTEISGFFSQFENQSSDSTVYSISNETSMLSVQGYDLDASYELYYLLGNMEDFNGEVFSTHLSKDGIYQIPYENDNTSGIVTLQRDENDALMFVRKSIDQSVNNLPYNAALLNSVHAIIDGKFVPEQILDMKLTTSPSYQMEIVYLNTTEGEYVIPFFCSIAKESYTGITEGSIYSAADFMKWLQQSFEFSPATDEEGNLLYGSGSASYIGGAAITPYGSNTPLPLWLYPAISAALLLGAVTFFVISKKANKKKNASLAANPT